MARPKYTTLAVNKETAELVDDFRIELEQILRRRVYTSEVLSIAVKQVRGNAATIVSELEPV